MNTDYGLTCLYQLLLDADLLNYFDAFKSELKVTSVDHLKYVTGPDLSEIGMTKPERRRFMDFKEKLFPASVFGKLKKKVKSSVTGRETNQKTHNQSTGEMLLHSEQHIIPSGKIILCQKLGGGEFGEVWQGVWKTSASRKVQVAVKCIPTDKMASNTLSLVQEATIMHKIQHENIVCFYGIVLEPKNVMLVTQLAPLRSLLECLKNHHAKLNFNILRLCDIAEQICAGMAYLENNKLIHRDLAARNILVFGVDKVKISDFGLSRALGAGEDYYRGNSGVSVRLPIAWCAPECIKFLKFTSASDVWSFGVTLWEIFTYGFQPWLGMNGHQVLEAIDSPNGQRLEMPDDCPLDYYNVMLQMWVYEVNRRPKFADLIEILQEIRPETVRSVQSCSDGQPDHLQYDAGDLIVVLNKRPHEYPDGYYWKGIILQKRQVGIEGIGRTGLFSPSSTVAHLSFDPVEVGLKMERCDGLKSIDCAIPCQSTMLTSNEKPLYNLHADMELSDKLTSTSINSLNDQNVRNDQRILCHLGTQLRNSFIKHRTKVHKLHRHDISGPQNDLKHMYHVGVNGECFGEVGFLPVKVYVPLQIVTPFNAEKLSDEQENSNNVPPNASPAANRRLPRFPAKWNDLVSHQPPPIDDRRLPSTTSESAQLLQNFENEATLTSSPVTSTSSIVLKNDAKTEATDSCSLLDEVFEALQSYDFFGKAAAERVLTDGINIGHINSGARFSLAKNVENDLIFDQLENKADDLQLRTEESQNELSYFSSNIKLLSLSESKMLDDLTNMATKISDKTLAWERLRLGRLILPEEEKCTQAAANLLEPLIKLASSTFRNSDSGRSSDEKTFCASLPPKDAAAVDRCLTVDAENAYKTLVESCRTTTANNNKKVSVSANNKPLSLLRSVSIPMACDRRMGKDLNVDFSLAPMSSENGVNTDRNSVVATDVVPSNGLLTHVVEKASNFDDDDEADDNPLRLLRKGGASFARSFQRGLQRLTKIVGCDSVLMTSGTALRIPPPVPPKPSKPTDDTLFEQ